MPPRLVLATFLGFILGAGRPCLAQSDGERERRKDFYDHRKEVKHENEEREAGLSEYLQEQAAWDERRQKDLQDHLRRRKAETPVMGDKGYLADEKEKASFVKQMEVDREAYVAHKLKLRPKTPKEIMDEEMFALEEFDIPSKRPRYEVPKRVLFGARKIWEAKSSATGGSSPAAPFTPPAPPVPNFPPPPAFEDFGDANGGYIPPPPPPPEGFEGQQENFIPPPPPPPMPFPEENGGFPPPPPPPGTYEPGY